MKKLMFVSVLSVLVFAGPAYGPTSFSVAGSTAREGVATVMGQDLTGVTVIYNNSSINCKPYGLFSRITGYLTGTQYRCSLAGNSSGFFEVRYWGETKAKTFINRD
ncbi:hypothetical protein [Campylobacter sp. RM12637]|uniref:hypothetical protein n=1 Tax=Campylobacter sp. RM12637 TaxID=2735734 RepID=UPI00301448B7|nr:hypothetical protein [Campylobacter sp. RM12637]